MKASVGISVIVALMAVAIEPIIVKLGYAVKAKPFELLFLRFITSSLLILPFCKNLIFPRGKSLYKILEISLIFAATNMCTYFALTSLTSIMVITIVTTTPAFVALINVKRGTEVLGKMFWPGFMLCFLGVLFSIDIFESGLGTLNPQGIAWIIAAVSGSIIYRTKMDALTQIYQPFTLSKYIFLTGGFIGLVGILFLPQGSLMLKTLPFSLWTGMAAVIGNVAFLSALKVLGSTRMSIITILQRPILIFTSAFVLHEKLGWQQFLGIVIILIGIQFAKVKKHELVKT